jgi:type IV pilus biogenesis protein CpaD/CtpE
MKQSETASGFERFASALAADWGGSAAEHGVAADVVMVVVAAAAAAAVAAVVAVVAVVCWCMRCACWTQPWAHQLKSGSRGD